MDQDFLSSKVYSNKIRTVESITSVIGSFPRKKKVIMCHGTFDIVHPGHIRHLIYAKKKADILIVSLTCDKFITKDNYRPFIPENLRAINLAALEVVDYVIIDRNSVPIKNIKKIKPDFFAKGFEYNKNNISQKTKDEITALEEYGGKIIFTPGDIIFSSSSIITKSPPDIKLDKLLFLMNSQKVSFQDLIEVIKKFKNLKVHVVGDTIIDAITECSMIGGMTKTPTMSFRVENEEKFIGGAAIVAKHLKKAGANTTLTTICGNDKLSHYLYSDLKKNKIKTNLINDNTRPTTEKNAIICNNYRIIKLDRVDNREISSDIIKSVSNLIKKTNTKAIIFSDFRHGIFTKNTIPFFIKSINKSVYKVADSQVASRWGNITDFKNFDLITPNEKEARFSLGDQDTVLRPLGLELYKKAKCKMLILKCGERGIITYQSKNMNNFRSFYSLDSFANNIVDPVGAGDALLAYATLSKLVSKKNIIASLIGNLAASLACEKNGNLPIGPSELIIRIKEFQTFKTK